MKALLRAFAIAGLAILVSAAPAMAATPVYVEWWRNNQRGITWEKDGPVSKWLIQKTGVGAWMPLVIWEGGEGYFAKLQTRIASGDIPDIFMPLKGIETSLIEDNKIWDLTDYLPKYAPNVWNKVSKEAWNMVRASNPPGKTGIYYIPSLTPSNEYAVFMRKDWLDTLKLPLPTDQKSYVAALRAFRDGDPNGNGKKDELPTIGRELGRWMDHLFYMYDVAMFEGYPQFDLYNGQLTYSAVTPNMKKAIEFIRGLYAEKLLDNDTFLNKANDLWARVSSDRVGSWYHIPRGLETLAFPALGKVNPKADVVVLPRIAAPGFNGYLTNKQMWGPEYSFAKKDEKTLIAGLTIMNWIMDDKNIQDIVYGVEGVHNVMKDGKKVMNPAYDENTMEKPVQRLFLTEADTIFQEQLSLAAAADDLGRMGPSQAMRAVKEAQKGQRRILASDGMPAFVFDGYPDIGSHKIYQEYMTKMIIGDWPMDKFDEFVAKWKASGGDDVTKRAQEWYKTVAK